VSLIPLARLFRNKTPQIFLQALTTFCFPALTKEWLFLWTYAHVKIQGPSFNNITNPSLHL
jgi:hypothetical protein